MAIISDEDVIENILQPELESAIYALITKSDKPVRYNDAGFGMIKNAMADMIAAYGPEEMGSSSPFGRPGNFESARVA